MPSELAVTEYRPMTRRQRRELEGYVAVSTTLGRAALFVAAVAAVGLPSWWIARRLPALADGPWWALPPLALAAWLWRAGGRWTGGPAYRKSVREDLAGGVVAVRRVCALEAIEVEEAEDEGPAYFLLTSEGRTLFVAYQELARLKSKGFPWTEFEIVEAPRCGAFFSIKKLGERLKPSQVRPPFSWEERKRLGFEGHYRVLEAGFETLRRW